MPAGTVVGQTNIHTNTNIKTYRLNLLSKKFRIRATLNLSTNEDSSTDTKYISLLYNFYLAGTFFCGVFKKKEKRGLGGIMFRVLKTNKKIREFFICFCGVIYIFFVSVL